MDSDRALHPHLQCLEIKMLYNGERSCSSGEKNDIKKVSFYREGIRQQLKGAGHVVCLHLVDLSVAFKQESLILTSPSQADHLIQSDVSLL